MEDIVNTDQRPKIEDFMTYLFLVLKRLSYDPREPATTGFYEIPEARASEDHGNERGQPRAAVNATAVRLNHAIARENVAPAVSEFRKRRNSFFFERDPFSGIVRGSSLATTASTL
jgi:Mg2+ and Co2+ transporter CorA